MNELEFLGDLEDPDALEGARIGVWSDGTVFAEDPNDPRIAATEAVMASAILAIEAQGAVIVDGANLDIGPAGAQELFALECEFKTDIASYLQTYTAAGYPKTLADLIDFNEANTDLEGPSATIAWNNAIWEEAEATGGRGDPECDAARAALTAAARTAITASWRASISTRSSRRPMGRRGRPIR